MSAQFFDIEKFTYDRKSKILISEASTLEFIPGVIPGDIPGDLVIRGKTKNVLFEYSHWNPQTNVYVFLPNKSWDNDLLIRNMALHILST